MSDDIEFDQDDEWFDDDGWVSIPNRMARDGGEDGLSWEARGMLVYLRSHSKKWKTRMADLEREGNCGRERTRRILGELIDAGYVERERRQTTPGGPLQWRYTTFRRRRSSRPTADPTVGKPVSRETRPSDGPTVGQPVDIEKTNSSEHQEQEHEDLSSPVADAPPDQEMPPEVRDDVERLCVRLRDHVIANGGKPPTITTTWRRDARLLLDRDGRNLGKALALLDWCQNDEFWAANVMSMGKFRKQYDQLRLKANAEWEKQHRPVQRQSPTTVAVNATQAAWDAYDQENQHRNGHRLASVGGRS